MKTLYININNEQIQSNDELEVLKYDFDSDFFFYLGEKIAKGCNIKNVITLVTDFKNDDKEEYKKIIAQWNEIKTILFSEKCEGEFEFILPNVYIHWLRYSEKYNHVHDKNFSHGEPSVISIDLEELYEESVEYLQKEILSKLKRNDLYLKVDDIVFNDDAVTLKSPIVSAIMEKYEKIGFKTYKKWIEDQKENDKHERGGFKSYNKNNKNKIFVGNDLEQDCNIKYKDKRLIKVRTDARVFTIKDGTKIIGEEAFQWCGNLEEVIIPETVEVIEDYAFAWCEKLKIINLDNIKYVGDYAFCGCKSLDSINLPMAIHIGSFAFKETAISWFYIGEDVNYIGDNPFAHCRLSNILCSSKNFESYDFALYTSNRERLITCFTPNDSFTVPEGVSSIDKLAFTGSASNLRHIELPDSITTIHYDHCFSDNEEWDMIEDITIPKGTRVKFELLFDNNLKINLIEKERPTFKTRRTFKIKGIEFNMIFVKAGEFTNGKGDKILLTNDYYIGETPVTQELFKTIMGYNPSYFNNIDYKNHPVEQVSWHDCVEFVSRLNSISKLYFRLPTEAEWDFAALGGVKSMNFKYCGGNNFDEVGWYACKANHKTHPVKQKFPNELGLYDMYGNVGEWCSDSGGYMTEEEELQYYEDIKELNNEDVHINPTRYGQEYTERGRVFKGDAYGPYTLDTVHCLAFEDVKLQSIGFRLVLEI